MRTVVAHVGARLLQFADTPGDAENLRLGEQRSTVPSNSRPGRYRTHAIAGPTSSSRRAGTAAAAQGLAGTTPTLHLDRRPSRAAATPRPTRLRRCLCSPTPSGTRPARQHRRGGSGMLERRGRGSAPSITCPRRPALARTRSTLQSASSPSRASRRAPPSPSGRSATTRLGTTTLAASTSIDNEVGAAGARKGAR